MAGRSICARGVGRSPLPVAAGECPVSLMGTYLALRLLGANEETDSAVVEARQQLLNAATRMERGQFISKARSGMPEAMVSFSRDDLDISYAAVMFAASPGAMPGNTRSRAAAVEIPPGRPYSRGAMPPPTIPAETSNRSGHRGLSPPARRRRRRRQARVHRELGCLPHHGVPEHR